MIATFQCDACRESTAGYCNLHAPGVRDVIMLNEQMECSRGLHVWMPWLQITDRSWVTWCVRCRHPEQYDA